MLGLDIPKDGSIPADTLASLGATWARFTADIECTDQADYCDRLRAVGIEPYVALDGDSYRRFGALNNPATWERAARWAHATFNAKVGALNPFNEPDGAGWESTQMPLSTVNGILHTFRDAGRWAQPLVGCGTSSGHVSYYDDVEIDLLDALDIHPYAKWTPAALHAILDQHLALGLPLWVGEVGLNTGDDDDQAMFLDWTCKLLKARADVVVALWFCAHPYESWGLLRADGSWRPSARTFQAIATPDPFDVGSGLRAMMDVDGTRPVVSSTWLPLGQHPSDIEESTGANGTIYRWSLRLNRGWRYPAL